MISFLVTLGSLLAFAQEPSASLPELEVFVPAAYPAERLIRQEEATVLLQLGVDTTGHVVTAEVVESAGEDFDAAAITAARGLVFRPARDAKGKETTAIIQYRYAFSLSKVPVVSIEGTAVEAGTTTPLLVDVEITGADGTFRTVTTDEQGAFRLAGLPAGHYKLLVYAAGFVPQSAEFDVTDGQVSEIALALVRQEERPEGEVDDTIVVTALKPTIEITQRALSVAEIQVLPGSNGDAVRVIQNLPGVARPPFNIGQLIIRGTSPEDSGAYLDGQRLPSVFHFGGLSTALNSDILDEVRLLPGGYGVRYGRTLGGVVDLSTTAEIPEKSRSYLSVDIYQTTAFTQQKLGDNTVLTLSGRRSYIDAVLTPILSSGGVTFRAPRYYDFQARVVHKFHDDSTLDVMFFNSNDKFKLVGESSDDDDTAIAISYVQAFQKFRALYVKPLADGVSSETSVLLGPESQSFSLGVFGEAAEKPFFIGVRQEFRRDSSPDELGFRLGVDALVANWRYIYDFEAFGTVEKDTAWSISPAMYAEVTKQAGPVTLIPGIRLDPWIMTGGYSTMAVDPRIAARWTISDATAIKASVGRFSQFPTPRQVLVGTDGNPSLTPQSSLQSQIGIDQGFGDFKIEASVFQSTLFDLVSGREDAFRFFSGPPPGGPLDTGDYANDGTGSIWGAEALVKYTDEKTAASLSATYSRSMRTKRPGQEAALFTYDQPLLLTVLGTRKLPIGWRAGARVRFTSGTPYTPVVNSYEDLENHEFTPVYGEENGERLPPYFALDVRIDKTWDFKNWDLTFYVDLQNATNRKNVDVMSWNYDYTLEEPIAGLPILPTFGLKGEW